MKQVISTFLTMIFALFLSLPAIAQATERTDAIRANGLIYIVLGVLVIIFLGLFIYLFVIDKKISKFEKNLNK